MFSGTESIKNNPIIRGFQLTYKNMVTGRLIELKPIMGKAKIENFEDFTFLDGEFVTDGYMKQYRSEYLYKIKLVTSL